MSVYTFEVYQVDEDRKKRYELLMREIHKSLREHAQEIPELLSYRTFEARPDGSASLSVELFEFTDEKGAEVFSRRFKDTAWLTSLQKQFFEIVDRGKMTIHTWTGFLEDDWFVR